MKNPHRARIFILDNCDWIDEIEHHPDAASPCDRWVGFKNQEFLGKTKRIKVKSWADGEIVTFAKKLQRL